MDLLNELFKYAPSKDDAFLTVSSKGVNAINSIVNLMEYIQNNFNEEDSDYLKKKFIVSIKTQNASVFERSLQLLYEKKQEQN